MGSKTDKIKGRIKEAVGALTDNDDLKREGQRDQAVGEVKEAAESAAQRVSDKVELVAEKVKDFAVLYRFTYRQGDMDAARRRAPVDCRSVGPVA